jgi:hypothetical protein
MMSTSGTETPGEQVYVFNMRGKWWGGGHSVWGDSPEGVLDQALEWLVRANDGGDFYLEVSEIEVRLEKGEELKLTWKPSANRFSSLVVEGANGPLHFSIDAEDLEFHEPVDG